MPHEPVGVDSARSLLVGREIDAVCFVRDYVELHLGGAVVRAISNPRGVVGGVAWQFPAGDAAVHMLRYIDGVVDEFDVVDDDRLTLGVGADEFVVPLDDATRFGPEAVHVVGVDESGGTSAAQLWIW